MRIHLNPYLAVSSVDNFCRAKIRPDILLGLICESKLFETDGNPERIFEKVHFEKNQQMIKNHDKFPSIESLTLKAPITIAADDKLCNSFRKFRQK